ncbi:MAG: FAD-dependent oxidoreductase [Candidatus Marinimicrobia bacterium]|nr:FAD-dependent oxidoreductase [Candidatus Neomarinimicrobiota bacterium]
MKRIHNTLDIKNEGDGDTKIGILGAGLTGLTLGYIFNNNGMRNFEILEKERECGGLMRSLREDGFTFDYGGSHIIFSKDKEVLDFMLKILGNNVTRNRRNTKILYKNHFVKYPFENGLADLPRQDNFECLNYFIQNLIKKEKGEFKKPKNLKEWFYYTFGKGIAEKYLIPYNEKIWKYPIEKISLEWVERIPNPPVEDIIKSSIGIDTEGYTHQLFFYYPKVGGIQALINSLEKNIKNIITGFEVKNIAKENDQWIVSSGREENIYKKIISTIPIYDLINALDVPKNVKNAADKLKYNSLITVMIGIDKPKINNFSWIYIPDKNILTHRVSFPSNYGPLIAPKDKSSVLAEITCNIDDEIWKMRDVEIMERTIEDLHKLKIISEMNVCYTNIRRLKYGYVINDLDYGKNMLIVKGYLNKIGIDLIGRFAEFRYLNMDACVRRAMDYCNLNNLRGGKIA